MTPEVDITPEKEAEFVAIAVAFADLTTRFVNQPEVYPFFEEWAKKDSTELGEGWYVTPTHAWSLQRIFYHKVALPIYRRAKGKQS